MRRTREKQDAICAIAWQFSSPHHTSAGWPPMCVFVVVSEAWRYRATSITVTEVLKRPIL